MSRVAVLGLGVMGLPIARRLTAGFSVAGFDVSAERRAKAGEFGVVAADTPSQAARGASVVVVAVRTLEQAREALFGQDATVEPGQVVVLVATVGSAGARTLGEELTAAGALFVDAPMSGSPARAEAGDLLIVVGGADDAVARAQPVLEALASTLVVVGARPGDGQALKTVNQLLCGVHIAATAEALILARRLGLDLETAFSALQAGAADSFMLRTRGRRVIEALEDGKPEFVSRLDLFVKDLTIVMEAAEALELELPTLAAARGLFERAGARGLGSGDDSGVVLAITAEDAET